MTSASASSTVPAHRPVWQPLLVRAVIALAFGAVTVFWASPSVQVLAVSSGLYLLANAAVFVWQRKVDPTPKTRLPLLIAAVVSALAGVVAFVSMSDAGTTAALSVALGVTGVVELLFWFWLRGASPLARDWIVSGFVGVGTAAALPFFTYLGAHALLGVTGGGAIISGVLWILSGLSARHDVRIGATGPKAVN